MYGKKENKSILREERFLWQDLLQVLMAGDLFRTKIKEAKIRDSKSLIFIVYLKMKLANTNPCSCLRSIPLIPADPAATKQQ